MFKQVNFGKKIVLYLLSALFSLCLIFGIINANNMHSVKADDSAASFEMIDGADLRLDKERISLRFSAKVPYNYTADKDYFMLICPVEWLDGVEFVENFDYKTYLEEKYPDENIVTLKLRPELLENGSTDFYFKGVQYFFCELSDICYQNLNTKYFAVAYYVDETGNHYATFNKDENVRSVFDIASQYVNCLAKQESNEIVNALVVNSINQKAGEPEENKNKDLVFNLEINGATFITPNGASYYNVVGNISGVDISGLNVPIFYALEGAGSLSGNLFSACEEFDNATIKATILGKNLEKIVYCRDYKDQFTLPDVVMYAHTANEFREIEDNLFSQTVAGCVVDVKIGDKFLEKEKDYFLDGSTVIFTTKAIKDNVGEKVVVISTENADYIINAKIATFAADKISDLVGNNGNHPTERFLAPYLVACGATSSDWNSYGARANGYVILLNDIDGTKANGANAWLMSGYMGYHNNMTSGSNISKAFYGFAGTFDGQGYSIYNVNTRYENRYNSVFGVAEHTAVYKDFSLKCSQEGNMSEGLFSGVFAATLSNVTLDITVNSSYSAPISEYAAGGKIENSTIILRKGSVEVLPDYALFEKVDVSYGDKMPAGASIVDTVLYSEYVVNSMLSGLNVYEIEDKLEFGINIAEQNVIQISGVEKILEVNKDVTSLFKITSDEITIPASLSVVGKEFIIIGSNYAISIMLIDNADVLNEVVTS